MLELPFTHELAALLKREPLCSTFFAPMHLRRLVVGYDFTLGRNRGGQVSVLRELGALTGFTVEQLEPVLVSGTVVSSTSLRGLIGQGDVARAATLLGRFHGFTGEVVHGDGRGLAWVFLLPISVSPMWCCLWKACTPPVPRLMDTSGQRSPVWGASPPLAITNWALKLFCLKTEKSLRPDDASGVCGPCSR